MTSALSFARQHGLTEPWFLFFAGYAAVLLAAVLFIGFCPEVIEI